MKKNKQPETRLIAEGVPPYIGLWTPQKLGALGIVAIVLLSMSVQGGIAAAIILLSRGLPGMGPLVNASCVLVGTVLCCTRRRWLQALGVGVNLAGGVCRMVT